MDAAGRLDPHEHDAIGQALWWLGLRHGTALERDDLMQEAHIALWRTRHSRRPGAPQDAMRVARNAMVEAARAELGRRDGSRRRMPGERVPYLESGDARIGGDCPESALRAKQALALLQRADDKLRAVVEALYEHGAPLPAARSLGYRSGSGLECHASRLRALLARAIVMH